MTKSDQNYGPKLPITSTFLNFPEHNLLTKLGQYAYIDITVRIWYVQLLIYNYSNILIVFRHKLIVQFSTLLHYTPL